MDYKSNIGKTFNNLVVLAFCSAPDHVKDKRSTYALIKCDCGNTKIVSFSNVVSGKTKSCGCRLQYSLNVRNNHIKNDTGKKYNMLTFVEIIDVPDKLKDKDTIYAKFLCDCGKETCAYLAAVRNNKIKSCGCVNKHTKAKDARLASARTVYRKRYNDGDLTFDDFLKMTSDNCFYCGKAPETIKNVFKIPQKKSSVFAKQHGDFIYNGLDRIDSNLKHMKSNLVTCCQWCNFMKSDLSQEDFFKKIEEIYKFYILKNHYDK